MSKRSPVEYLHALTMLIPGGIGLAVVGRTLAAYWRRDPVASVIVAVIGLALAVGLIELLWRQARAGALERELRALPATPSEATVDGASPVLSALLRSRLEQTPVQGLGESIAPYLTGLLVMLGLLGTLLGLFEAVHGAGRALTTSSDVDALRRGLSTPMDGLTRSFGCSAAGISASAMLGLALALVRRREARVLQAAQRYALGPLRALSPLRRQARALEQLAQGLGQREDAGGLAQVAQQLGALSERLVALQQNSLASHTQAVSELLGGLRSELSRVAGDAGAALHERVAPLVHDALARAGEAAQQQTAALAETTRTLTRALEAHTEAARGEAGALIAALGARMDEAEQARRQAQQAELASLSELASRSVRDAEARDRALEARWSELSQQVAASAAALREQEAARLERLDVLVARVGEDLGRVSTGVGEQLSGLVSGLGEQLGQLSTSLGQELAGRAESERAQDARATAVLAELSRSVELLDAGRAHQGQALEALIERVGTLFTELATTSQQNVEAVLAQLNERAREQAARLTELEEALSAARTEHARALEAQLTAHAERLEQKLGDTSALVREAAALWQASGIEMRAVADAFSQGVERQREASDAWLESLGDVEGAVERAGRHAAADALSDQLASTQEVFARQLQFQRELFEQLRSLRPAAQRGAHGEQDASV